MNKTMKCKELGIEFTLKQEQNGKKFSEIKIPKGWQIFDISLFMQLWVLDNYREAIMKANGNDLWIFFKNFDYLKDRRVAKFFADSDGALLSCNGEPLSSNALLGVLFWRKLK